MNHCESGHLPFTFLLDESVVCSQCVVCDALVDVVLIEVVALGAIDSVHLLLFFLLINNLAFI